MRHPQDATPLRRAPSGNAQLHQRRSLQDANQVSLQLSGNQLEQSNDPRGQYLRQIRKAQGRDPSAVATEACISLGQLYELETGGQRLFYSDTLREQAGRRVAQLLGVDWDALAAAQSQATHGEPDLSTTMPASERSSLDKSLQASQDDLQKESPLSRSMRHLVWSLALAILVLAAARLGWIPGLQLPL